MDEIRVLVRQWTAEEEKPGYRPPSASWPRHQPRHSHVPAYRASLAECGGLDVPACYGAAFTLAVALLGGALFGHAEFEDEAEPSAPEEAEGLALLSQLAALGSPEGACGLAFCLLDGPGEHTRDELAAAALFERAAHAGLPQAMSELATMHFLGDGIPEDAILAAHWFRRAAEGGVPAAMYLWGECLLEGRGCARDASHAREWFLAAGKLGHRGARHRIITECAQEAADDERLEARDGRASGRRGSRWDSRDGTASREPES